MTPLPLISRRAALAMAGGELLACCATRSDPHVIRVAYTPLTLRSMYEVLAAGFSQTHPGLSVELVPATTYDTMLERDLRLSLVGEELDVSHAGTGVFRFYVERGLASPLDRFLAAEAHGDVVRHQTIGMSNGVTYGIPFALSVPVLYYNIDLMRRAGIDPETFNGSWSAILASARQISRLPSPVSGIYFDYAELAFAWEVLVYSRGGVMMSPADRRIEFGGADGLWAMQLLHAIGRAGQRDMSRDNARVALINGLLGFYENTSSNLRKFAAQAQDIALGMTVVPTAPGGTLPAAGSLAVISARDPARRELAWSYVRFACGPIGQAIMARNSGYLSLNPKAIADPHGVGGILARDPLYAKAHAALPLLQPAYAFPGPNSGRIDDAIGDIMRRVILGRIAPAAALSEMTDAVQDLVQSP